MTIIFENGQDRLSLTLDDGDLYISILETTDDDEGREVTTHIPDVDKFIESIKFLMGSKSV